MSQPMNFIRDFLNYIEKQGIYDEFDKTSQKMVTSEGVEALIREAQSYLPEKLKPLASANRMRDLSDEERNQLIENADKERIIDMRKHFQAKMSANNGAQGLIERLVLAVDRNDQLEIASVLLDAKAVIVGPENVLENQ